MVGAWMLIFFFTFANTCLPEKRVEICSCSNTDWSFHTKASLDSKKFWVEGFKSCEYASTWSAWRANYVERWTLSLLQTLLSRCTHPLSVSIWNALFVPGIPKSCAGADISKHRMSTFRTGIAPFAGRGCVEVEEIRVLKVCFSECPRSVVTAKKW